MERHLAVYGIGLTANLLEDAEERRGGWGAVQPYHELEEISKAVVSHFGMWGIRLCGMPRVW